VPGVTAAGKIAPDERDTNKLLDDVAATLTPVLVAARDVTSSGGDVEVARAVFRAGLEAALRLPGLGSGRLCAGLADEWAWVAIAGRLVAQAIGSVAGSDVGPDGGFEELQLGSVVAGVFRDLGLDEGSAWRMVSLIRMLGRLPLAGTVLGMPVAEQAPALVDAFVADESVRPYIRVNIWQGVTWFNRESFEQVLWWLLALDALSVAGADSGTVAKSRLPQAERLIDRLSRAATKADYQLDMLADAARG